MKINTRGWVGGRARRASTTNEIWLPLRPEDLHRARQLLNTYSGKWQHRGDLLLMLEEEGDEMGVAPEFRETRLARCDSADVAELIVQLRDWFWPLWNELVRTRMKLVDAQKECAELTKLLKREGVFE